MEGIKNTYTTLHNKHEEYVKSITDYEQYQQDNKEKNKIFQRDTTNTLENEIKRAESLFDIVTKEQEYLKEIKNGKEELYRLIEQYKENVENKMKEIKKEEGKNEKERYEIGNELCKMYKEKHTKETS